MSSSSKTWIGWSEPVQPMTGLTCFVTSLQIWTGGWIQGQTMRISYFHSSRQAKATSLVRAFPPCNHLPSTCPSSSHWRAQTHWHEFEWFVKCFCTTFWSPFQAPSTARRGSSLNACTTAWILLSERDQKYKTERWHTLSSLTIRAGISCWGISLQWWWPADLWPVTNISYCMQCMEYGIVLLGRIQVELTSAVGNCSAIPVICARLRGWKPRKMSYSMSRATLQTSLASSLDWMVLSCISVRVHTFRIYLAVVKLILAQKLTLERKTTPVLVVIEQGLLQYSEARWRRKYCLC